MLMVNCINLDLFKTTVRGHSFELHRRGNGWRVYVENAAVRAYGTLGSKDFDSLADVEKKYKSLRGIEALIMAEIASQEDAGRPVTVGEEVYSDGYKKGYRGNVVELCTGQLEGMVYVRFPGGVKCVCASEVKNFRRPVLQ